MTGLDFDGPLTVCATCTSEIDFVDDEELGICRHCGEAFLLDLEPADLLARSS
jgi:DNA-directed RNA polymerase subunit RPC12/RpoP